MTKRAQKVVVSVSIDPTVWHDLRKRALKKNTSASAIIESLVREELKKK